MRNHLAYVVTLAVAATGAVLRAQHPAPSVAHEALQRQVLLDRAGFSPGELDGQPGSNTTRALAAYKHAHQAATGTPDDAALRGRPRGHATDTLVRYTITMQDVAGPYMEIPDDMAAKAELKSLGYASMMEALGERFHTAPGLLLALNRRVTFSAGAVVSVPNVEVGGAPGPAAAARVVVSKSASSLTAFDGADRLIFFAPVTSGSEHDPLPIGSWTITAVLRNPTYNYNPDLFWDAKPGQVKAQLPAGPNGPVGVVWMDISKENYGLHGTPEPSQIGHSTSHGCVRLTNWDASRLASLVKKGTPVVFVE